MYFQKQLYVMNRICNWQLFDYLAECLEQFVKENDLSESELPLGFTFSFPCKQEGLAVGRLIRWTKGFKCAGVEGKDVVKLLQDAICRRKVMYVAYFVLHRALIQNFKLQCRLLC